MTQLNKENDRTGGRRPGADPERKGSAVSQSPTHETAGFLRRYFVDPLVRSRNPPWFDARGIAAGLAIGFGVPVGAQMVCLGVARLLIRFNTLIAFTFTWVNNPVTLIPMYYGYYYLGSIILGKPEVMTLEGFHQLMHPVTKAGYFWQSLRAFAYLGVDLVLRWATAAAILSIGAGTLGYVVGHIVQTRRCARRARKLGMSYERLVAELEKSLKKNDGAAV